MITTKGLGYLDQLGDQAGPQRSDERSPRPETESTE
jgi:hypothetical protein